MVGNLRFSVSCTTRPPRPGEVDGVDYRFISEKEFEEMIQGNRLAEWAVVHGNRYGTPIDELDRAMSSGVDLILDLDVQGARSIRSRCGRGVFVFVLPSSFDALKERLIKRKSEEAAEIIQRLDDAKEEMEEIEFYDYIIINDSLDEASQNLAAIVLAERCRRERVLRILSRLGGQ